MNSDRDFRVFWYLKKIKSMGNMICNTIKNISKVYMIMNKKSSDFGSKYCFCV